MHAEEHTTTVLPKNGGSSGRARQSVVQADIAQCMRAFLTLTGAVIALTTGRLLQLMLLVHLFLHKHVSHGRWRKYEIHVAVSQQACVAPH
jgi:hypothetical protein